MSWNICSVPRLGHLEAEPAGVANYLRELDRLTHAFGSEEFADLRVGKGRGSIGQENRQTAARFLGRVDHTVAQPSI